MAYKYIIGADEVGYGCWAGHLYICAVKASQDWSLKGLNDSKKLSEKKRLEMTSKLKELQNKKEISFGFAICPVEHIDAYGMADCLKLTYGTAIANLYCDDSEVILDGTLKASEIKRVMEKYQYPINFDISHFRSEIKADGKFPTVMAASILAKTARDGNMKEVQHKLFPNYGFDKHVGYGTKEHRKAIEKNGLCALHRKSYEPMKSIIAHKFLDKIIENNELPTDGELNKIMKNMNR